MNKAALAACLLAFASLTAATPWDKRWYVSAMGGEHFTDDELGDSDAAWSLQVGKHFHAEWAFEVSALHNGVVRHDASDLTQQSVSINFMKVNRVPLWNPYFLMGFGLTQTSGDGLEDSTKPHAQLGLGGSWMLTPRGTMLRADLRWRFDNETLPEMDTLANAQFLIGLTIPFGSGR